MRDAFLRLLILCFFIFSLNAKCKVSGKSVTVVGGGSGLFRTVLR